MKNVKQLPGDFGIPLIGHTHNLFLKREIYFQKSHQYYGGTFKTNLLGKKTVVFSDLDVCQEVLINKDEYFSMGQGWFFLKPLLSDGLFLQDGEKHQFTRKLIFPAFHGEAVENCIDVIKQCVNSQLIAWDRQKQVNLCQEFHTLALRVACTIFIGQELERAQELFVDFVEGLTAVLRLNIPGTKFRKAILARKKLENLIRDVLNQRRESHENRSDILAVLMNLKDEDGRSLTDEEIIIQTIQFIFAGHETTARMLCWSIYELQNNPDELIRLQKAYQEVSNEGFTLNAIMKNKDLEFFFLEVERLYSPSPFIPRGLNQDVELGGYKIPKNWMVMLAPSIVHQRSDLFMEPNRFDTSRFRSPREEHKVHPFSLLGFGGGQHRCLGELLAKVEMKIALLEIATHYDFNLTHELNKRSKDKPMHLIEPTFQLAISQKQPTLVTA